MRLNEQRRELRTRQSYTSNRYIDALGSCLVLLELAVLGLLKDRPLHGYELKKRLADTLGRTVSDGSLYPALARLMTTGGAAEIDETAGPNELASNRDSLSTSPLSCTASTGSLSGEFALLRNKARTMLQRGTGAGKARRVYAITEEGEAMFADMLAAQSRTADDDSLFAIKLAFARYLPSEQRLALFENRRARLNERLDVARQRLRAGWDRVDNYTRAVLEHGADSTMADIGWIDRLIAAEKERSSARTQSSVNHPVLSSSHQRSNVAAPTFPKNNNKPSISQLVCAPLNIVEPLDGISNSVESANKLTHEFRKASQ